MSKLVVLLACLNLVLAACTQNNEVTAKKKKLGSPIPLINNKIYDAGFADSNDLPTDPATLKVIGIKSNLQSDFIKPDELGIVVIDVSGDGVWQARPTDADVWVTLGTVSETTALLVGPGGRLRYLPTLNEVGSPFAKVRLWNENCESAGASIDVSDLEVYDENCFSAQVGRINFESKPVNDPPKLILGLNPDLNSVTEDHVAPLPGQALGTLISTLIDDKAVPGGIDNFFDPDVDSQVGMAVVNTREVEGVFWKSLNNGVTWELMGSVSESCATTFLADAGTRVFFQPTLRDFAGTIMDVMAFKAWDGGGAANGEACVDVSNMKATTEVAARRVFTVSFSVKNSWDLPKNDKEDGRLLRKWRKLLGTWSYENWYGVFPYRPLITREIMHNYGAIVEIVENPPRVILDTVVNFDVSSLDSKCHYSFEFPVDLLEYKSAKGIVGEPLVKNESFELNRMRLRVLFKKPKISIVSDSVNNDHLCKMKKLGLDVDFSEYLGDLVKCNKGKECATDEHTINLTYWTNKDDKAMKLIAKPYNARSLRWSKYASKEEMYPLAHGIRCTLFNNQSLGSLKDQEAGTLWDVRGDICLQNGLIVKEFKSHFVNGVEWQQQNVLSREEWLKKLIQIHFPDGILPDKFKWTDQNAEDRMVSAEVLDIHGSFLYRVELAYKGIGRVELKIYTANILATPEKTIELIPQFRREL